MDVKRLSSITNRRFLPAQEQHVWRRDSRVTVRSVEEH